MLLCRWISENWTAPEAIDSAVIGDVQDPHGDCFKGAASAKSERNNAMHKAYMERIVAFDPIFCKRHTGSSGVMNMKKIIAFILVAFVCQAAQPPRYYGYGSVHMMGGYPMVGVGLRTQKGINGFDISGSAFPYFTRFADLPFHIKSLYLFHPRSKGIYLGAGLGLLNEPETIRISGSFEGSFGFEWRIKKGNVFFLEADVIGPFRKSIRRVYKDGKAELQEKRALWPGLSFGYGF